MLYNGVIVTVTCVTSMSHFVNYITVTYNITPLLLPRSKIKKKKLQIKLRERKSNQKENIIESSLLFTTFDNKRMSRNTSISFHIKKYKK